MSIASSTIELIKNLDVADAVSGGISAFLGAFFAFCFFMVGRWIERRYERKKVYKDEHDYLDRYLQELKYIIIENRDTLKAIIEGYNTEKIQITPKKLTILPVREDSSMKVKDKLFKNRLETYINNGIKKLNRQQEGIIWMQDSLNNEIMGGPILVNQLKKRIDDFSKISKWVLKLYNYYLDIIEQLIIENRVLYKKIRNWKNHKAKMDKLYSNRLEETEKEKKSFKKDYVNPLLLEQRNLLIKHELWDEEKDK